MTQSPDTGVVPEFTQGDRLGKALRHADVSAQEMAELLGVHRNTISAYINDRHEAKAGVLRLWAMRCGVPFEWLAAGVGTSTPTPPGPGRGKRDHAALDALAAQKAARSHGGRNTGRYHFPSLPDAPAA